MKLLIALASMTLMLSIVLVRGQTVKGSIEGRVQNAKTGEPIAGAQVTLDPNGVPAGFAVPANLLMPVTATDSQGWYLFRDVDAGQYKLIVQFNGFARTEYGQKIYPGQGIPVRVAPGQDLKDVSIALQPTGVISGRILNRDGNPVPFFPVQLAQPVYDSTGQHFLNMRLQRNTNDRGEYRFFYVTPGDYIVAAGFLPGSTVVSPTDQQVYGYAFYPDASDVKQAVRVEILPGVELSGFDVRVPKVENRFYRIRGILIDSRTGMPPPSASFILNFRALDRAGVMGTSYSEFPYNPKTGEFVFSRVTPGSYGVTATYQDGPARGGGTSYRAYAPVRVSESDVEGLVLRTADSISISGRVRIEGQDSPPQRLVMQFQPASGDLDGIPLQLPATIAWKPDGTFTVTQLVAGEYRVSVTQASLPSGAYVKEVRYGTMDLRNQNLVIGSTLEPETRLEILLSMKTGQIDGDVVDAQGRPAEPNPVMLVPDANRDRPELFRLGTVDRSGHFTIANVAPGDYKVFAWEALEPFAYFDPAVLKRIEDSGTRVHLDESGHEHIEVKQIPAQ